MSLRKAINEKCRDCTYDEYGEGTWLKQVELCTCTDCPLYPVRPTPRERNAGNDSKLRDEKGRIMKIRPLEIEL